MLASIDLQKYLHEGASLEESLKPPGRQGLSQSATASCHNAEVFAVPQFPLPDAWWSFACTSLCCTQITLLKAAMVAAEFMTVDCCEGQRLVNMPEAVLDARAGASITIQPEQQ